MPLFSTEEIEAAQALVYSQMDPTPQITWPLLGARVGAEVVVKHENHAPTGAFKVRGGITLIDWLKRAHPEARGIVTITDSTISEITANVKGAIWYGQQAGLKVRTIINIGGQDTKVIGIDEQGVTKNFSMNDKCAAGTGRFLEALARILEVEVVDLGDLALEADVPIRINSTCTVFAETEIISLLAREKKPSEIVAGAHFAIAKRLAKMARRVKVTDQVFFDGGPALNKGLIKALEDELATDLFVPPEVPQVTTAIGAAMIAREEYKAGMPVVELPKTSSIQGTEKPCQTCPQ